MSITVNSSASNTITITASTSSTTTVLGKGVKGDKGDTGATGATGPAGSDGADGQGVPVGGAEGQVLVKSSATDYDTAWDYVESTYLQVENAETTSIPAGTVVYAFGISGSNITVKKADASNSSTMPAIGVVLEEIASGSAGEIITSGLFNKTISGLSGINVGDTVYVSETAGDVTTTKPTGTALIQNIGVVLKTNGSNIQKMKVSAIDRVNDIPNIPNGQAWIGNASGVPTPTTLATVATSGSYSDLSSTPPDLTIDGAGTIHANNVPTLNQNTTGTAAGLSSTLAVSSGGTGATTLADNSLLTGTGTSAITAESNLTFDGSILTITGQRKTPNPASDGFQGDIVAFGSGPNGNDDNIEAGKLYYLDSSQEWEETDADAVASSKGMLGIATDDDAARFLVKGFARATAYGGFTTGDVLYLSTTAGTVTNTAPTAAGDVVRIVGYVSNASVREIYFDPSKEWIEL
jgi:predicted RecA/RadA family phage recombinase